MQVRKACAPQFYAGDCARLTEQFLKGFSVPEYPSKTVAGIVPHAGWQYSGAVAAKVFKSIQQKKNPATFVILGAVHRWPGANSVYARGAWATPLGNIEIDEDLAAKILEGTSGWTVEEANAHDGEHSIEVQLPFLKYMFPQAKLVPILVNPDSHAILLGRRVGEILKNSDRSAVVIGSSDLTHYGNPYAFTPAGYGPKAHHWMRESDGRILRLTERMKAAELLREAIGSHSACGPGAMAATIAAAGVLGAERGYLVEYTTSHDVEGKAEFRTAVGYAGLLF